MPMITNINDYFTKGCGRCARFDTPDCSALKWHTGLSDLRRICLDMGLVETVKWGQPCYMHAGRNIVIFGAMRGQYVLTFFKAALMKDPEKILVKQGANSRTYDRLPLSDNADVKRLEPIIRRYLAEAMGYAEAGIVPEKIVVELDWPDELTNALDDDPELAEAFENLTPGRQKSYLYNLNAAKNPATRINRIAKFRDKILAGKGALDR